MPIRSLAHLSDLHLGESPHVDVAAADVCHSLLSVGVDHVVVTGDLTHKGRHSELQRFNELFAPLLAAGKMTIVPGNHDRVGEDAGASLMNGERVRVSIPDGLYLIQIDSTDERNRSYFAPHGTVCERVLAEVDRALDAAPSDRLCVVLLHHHALPMPEETWGERFASSLGWPHARELELGPELLTLALGRCDLVLHGHRHTPRTFSLPAENDRTLAVFNGGATTDLLRFRLFLHAEGALIDSPHWIRVPSSVPREKPGVIDGAWRELRAALA